MRRRNVPLHITLSVSYSYMYSTYEYRDDSIAPDSASISLSLSFLHRLLPGTRPYVIHISVRSSDLRGSAKSRFPIMWLNYLYCAHQGKRCLILVKVIDALVLSPNLSCCFATRQMGSYLLAWGHGHPCTTYFIQ
jgi:hypothetical protein